MFSNGLFDGVAESSTEPQGVVMPPMLPEGFGEMWYSEGDLVNRLVDKFGDATAVAKATNALPGAPTVHKANTEVYS